MHTLRNVFIIGPMGAGKSTIGRAVAQLMKYEFYDSDIEIEKRSGAEIGWIFDIEGEDGFRKREAQVIDDLTQLNHIVLATGGGAVITPENRVVLASRGTVIYLSSSLEQQYTRTRRDEKRPLLQTPNVRDTIDKLWEERRPLYEDIADYVFSTDDVSVRSISQRIVKQLMNDAKIS